MDNSEKEIKDIEELIDRLGKLNMGNINEAQRMETTEKLLRAKIEKLNLYNLKETNSILNNINNGLGSLQSNLSNLDISIKDGIESNKKYGISIKVWTIVLAVATIILALVGSFQAYLLIEYTKATTKIALATELSAKASLDMALQMKYTNQVNLKPYLVIIPMQPYYDREGNLTMPYILENTKAIPTYYKKSHRVFKVDRLSGKKEEIKPWTKETKYTGMLSAGDPQLIHPDIIGKYYIKNDDIDKEYFLIELKVDYKSVEDFGFGDQFSTREIGLSPKSYIEENRNEFNLFFPPKYEGYGEIDKPKESIAKGKQS